MAVQGKTAVVTGGNDGLGRAMVLAFARGGWDVAFNYLTGEDKAQSLVAEVLAIGRRVLALRSDVGVKAEVDSFYAALGAWGATPDVLVNNAGVQT